MSSKRKQKICVGKQDCRVTKKSEVYIATNEESLVEEENAFVVRKSNKLTVLEIVSFTATLVLLLSLPSTRRLGLG
ncbi:unnamed protein product [Arabis nemorensis]|uniref:Uncharacterized protein n=1 Tax=Arabis nemorensis TaxID=586526 RepID=A0A565AY45_9BRAS|nr:unnamed protein product [Arabis nemorensis]